MKILLIVTCHSVEQAEAIAKFISEMAKQKKEAR